MGYEVGHEALTPHHCLSPSSPPYRSFFLSLVPLSHLPLPGLIPIPIAVPAIVAQPVQMDPVGTHLLHHADLFRDAGKPQSSIKMPAGMVQSAIRCLQERLQTRMSPPIGDEPARSLAMDRPPLTEGGTAQSATAQFPLGSAEQALPWSTCDRKALKQSRSNWLLSPLQPALPWVCAIRVPTCAFLGCTPPTLQMHVELLSQLVAPCTAPPLTSLLTQAARICRISFVVQSQEIQSWARRSSGVCITRLRNSIKYVLMKMTSLTTLPRVRHITCHICLTLCVE